jgi:hypothetical protein
LSVKTETFGRSQGKLQGVRDLEIRNTILIYKVPRAKSMRNAWLNCVVFCALAATSGCRTPSVDWNGSWKMNPSKGNFHGSIFTISISADGEYRYDNGYSSFTFRCDGKDRPVRENQTQACVKHSDTVLDLTQKENGEKTRVVQWELSGDGTVFTSTSTSFRPTGPVITGRVVGSRVSGSNGFAGQWRDPSYLQQHADMTLSLDAKSLHIGYPSAGQYIDAPLDGADAPVRGPHVPEGLTDSVRLIRRREISILAKRNGKVDAQESLELSYDGRVITYSWWSPDRPAAKSTFVYERKQM